MGEYEGCWGKPRCERSTKSQRGCTELARAAGSNSVVNPVPRMQSN